MLGGGGNSNPRSITSARAGEVFAHQDLVGQVVGGVTDQGVALAGAAAPRAVPGFARRPLTASLSPLARAGPAIARGEREKRSGGGITQGCARSSLTLGYYQVIPSGISDGERSQSFVPFVAF